MHCGTRLPGCRFVCSVTVRSARLQGKDLANPTALLLSGVMMLRHLDLVQQADMIQTACLKTIADGKYRTGDLGGNATTTQYTDAVIGNMQG